MNIESIIADHHVPVYRYAYRLVGSVADAEDLTQQTFLVAQQKLHQLRDETKTRSWLYAVLRSCYFRHCRKKQPTPAANLEMRVEEIPAAVAEAGFEIDSDDLQSALNGLPDEYKSVVLLFYFEQKSYKDIAAELDLPMGTVMSRLARAKGRLRHELLEPEKPSRARQPDHRGVNPRGVERRPGRDSDYPTPMPGSVEH